MDEPEEITLPRAWFEGLDKLSKKAWADIESWDIEKNKSIPMSMTKLVGFSGSVEHILNNHK